MYDMLPSLLSTNACRGEDGRRGRRFSHNIRKTEDGGVDRQTLFVPRRPAWASSAPLRQFVDLRGGKTIKKNRSFFTDEGQWLKKNRRDDSILLVKSSQTWTEPPSTTSLETCLWIILEPQHQQRSVRDPSSTVAMLSILTLLFWYHERNTMTGPLCNIWPGSCFLFFLHLAKINIH